MSQPQNRPDSLNSTGSPAFDAADQLAALGQAVITTDVQGRVVYWNAAAEELYGWTAAEALGRPISTLSVPDIAQEVAADIMAALRKGIPWSGGFPVRRKDGRMFPALVTDAGIYRDGELVGIIGVSTNLGSAVRPLLERSSDAALVLRSDALVTYVSPAVEGLFGWQEEAVVGGSIIDLIHPEDRTTLADFLTEVVAQPGSHPAVELRVRQGDDWRWAEAALTNLLDDPFVRGVVCNLRPDLRREALLDAEARVAQLQQALDSRLLVERAKGYAAGRYGLDPEEVFEQMRAAARSRRAPLREIAAEVLAGSRPGGAGPTPPAGSRDQPP